MSAPVILCGLGKVGARALQYLQTIGLPVVVIDQSREAGDPVLAGVRLIKGDFRKRQTLEEAGIRDCRGVLVLTSDDMVNLAGTLLIRSLNPTVRIVLRVFNENLIARLGRALPNLHPLSTATLAAPLMVAKALTGEALGTFHVGQDSEAQLRQVLETVIEEGSPLVGRTIEELADRGKVLVLRHVPAGGAERLLTDVQPDARLAVGDRVAVCGEPQDVATLLEGDQEAVALRWSNWFRRTGRALWRTFAEMDLAVKICFLSLLAVIVFSTLFLVLARHNHALADSLYRTVSIIATAADMKTELDPDEVKVFVSFLRLLGAALLAAFTAVLTNYLVRASLKGALEVRHLPDSGHVVVAGLGAIGYACVDELARAGEKVVVIELAADNRFVSTVRSKGIPVIIGDASLKDVMEQAQAGRARAIIASASSDMVNLEVALVARELNAEQRVVVLMADPNLADLMRVSADVRLALSIPDLTAPAFVAGLFGDRVRNVLQLQDRLLVVLDMKVRKDDRHLIGQSVRTVATDLRLLPVALLPGDGSPPPRQVRHRRLNEGDRLIGIATLPDLERILGHQPVEKCWAVDIQSFPSTAREWLTMLVQRTWDVSEEQAAERLRQTPFCLEQALTRGQALDLLELLRRERVQAVMRPASPVPEPAM